LSRHKKKEVDGNASQKTRLDLVLGKIIEFVLDMFEDLEKKIQLRKFIRFANVMFDVVSIKFSFRCKYI